MKVNLRKDLPRLLVVVVAAFIMACNIRFLVRSAGLFPGGATGLTLLIQEIFSKFFQIDVPYTIINLAINAIPIYIGFRFIGKKFTLLSCVMIVLTSVFTDLLPGGVVITEDVLLISVFGGIINGFVISTCLRVDATSGGTDFIAVYLSQKKGMESFNIALGINVVILCTAGVLFGWDKALYSIIFQYASTQVLHVLYKRYQKETFFIVTNRPSEVCQAIRSVSGHASTVLEGEGSYENKKRNVVYSIVALSEKQAVLNAVKAADEKAFINTIKTEQLSGRFRQPTIE